MNWKPWKDIPDNGSFLVWFNDPVHNTHIHSCYRFQNLNNRANRLSIIDGLFEFDMIEAYGEPDYWIRQDEIEWPENERIYNGDTETI